MKGSIGHSDLSCGEEHEHATSTISCILKYLSLRSSQKKHSSRQLYGMCDSTPYSKVTVRRPRRLRKRHPNPYKHKFTPSNIRLDMLSGRSGKEIWVWDSCSTIEPFVEILHPKKDLESLEFDNGEKLDSAIPELFIGGTCHNNCGYTSAPSGLSSFVPHVLETIEEADVETRWSLDDRTSRI